MGEKLKATVEKVTREKEIHNKTRRVSRRRSLKPQEHAEH